MIVIQSVADAKTLCRYWIHYSLNYSFGRRYLYGILLTWLRLFIQEEGDIIQWLVMKISMNRPGTGTTTFIILTRNCCPGTDVPRRSLTKTGNVQEVDHPNAWGGTPALLGNQGWGECDTESTRQTNTCSTLYRHDGRTLGRRQLRMLLSRIHCDASGSERGTWIRVPSSNMNSNIVHRYMVPRCHPTSTGVSCRALPVDPDV